MGYLTKARRLSEFLAFHIPFTEVLTVIDDSLDKICSRNVFGPEKNRY